MSCEAEHPGKEDPRPVERWDRGDKAFELFRGNGRTVSGNDSSARKLVNLHSSLRAAPNLAVGSAQDPIESLGDFSDLVTLLHRCVERSQNANPPRPIPERQNASPTEKVCVHGRLSRSKLHDLAPSVVFVLDKRPYNHAAGVSIYGRPGDRAIKPCTSK